MKEYFTEDQLLDSEQIDNYSETTNDDFRLKTIKALKKILNTESNVNIMLEEGVSKEECLAVISTLHVVIDEFSEEMLKES